MPIPIGFAQANFRFTGASMPEGAEITLGLDITAHGGSPADVASDLDAIWTLTGLSANLSTGTDLTEILVKFGPDATGPSAVEPANTPGTGGAAGVPNTAFLVQKVTAFGGKAGRGRMYLPGVPEASVSQSGTLTAGIATAIQTDLNTLMTELGVQNLEPVVLHGDNSPLSTPSPITSFLISTKVATQRRRLRP